MREMVYRKLWAGLAVAMSWLPAWAQDQAPPQTTDQKIQQLEQKVNELEKEVKADQTTDNGQNAASSTADTTGFTIRSKDGNFVLHIGADLQVDNRSFFGAGSSGTRTASSCAASVRRFTAPSTSTS